MSLTLPRAAVQSASSLIRAVTPGLPVPAERPVRVHPRPGVFAHQVFPSDSEQHFSMSFDLKSWTGFLRHRADLWFLWVLAQGRW